MANRTTDTVATIGKGTVAVPFQFTVDGSGVVTAQYPSKSVLTIAQDGTTSSKYNLTFVDSVPAVIACTATVVKAGTVNAKIEPISVAATPAKVVLQARLSSTGAPNDIASADVHGVVWLRNSTVKT